MICAKIEQPPSETFALEIGMLSANRRASLRRAAYVSFAVLLAACGRQNEPTSVAIPAEARADQSELKWARAALERNPELKVESVDENAQTIKVRIKATGETVTVAPGELAAIPIGDLVALSNASRTAKTEPAPVPAAPKVTEEPIPPEAPAAKTSDYKVERDNGRVRISGPGVSIESTTNSAGNARSEPEKFDEPIICEGRRTLFLDRRRMNVSGEAIIARDGCELHLTNSQITASGTAVVVQNATVHIGNSTVQGAESSVDMRRGARLFLQKSQFIGISRRDPDARITDQGGNTWR